MKKPILLCLLAASLTVVSRADQAYETNKFTFPDPSKPGTVRITLMHGSVHVHGSDRTDVEVRSSIPLAHEHRADGLRVLGASTGLEVHQHDNTLIIEAGAEHVHGDANFDIEVPKRSSIAVTTFSGRIHCDNIVGDADIHSMSGGIDLDHLAGGATIEASNGHIHAGFTSLTSGHPVSVMSLNGEVVLTLPSDAKANLQLRTQNGTILTDYSEQQLVTTTVPTDKVRALGTTHKDRDRDDDNDNDSDDANEHLQEARDAAREAAEQARDAARDAAREAARAIKEAADEAREGLAESGIELPPLPPLPPMTGGKTISGVLNGGGIEVQVTTLNGDVTIRKGS